MIKKQKDELSKAVSQRIEEILRMTKLPIEQLGRIAGINIRSLKGYHRGGIPITLESILKICAALSLAVNEFCDFSKKLSLKKQPSARTNAIKVKSEIRMDEEKEALRFAQQEKYEMHKKHRDQILHIIHKTDYFLRPRTLFQMVVDFADDYKLYATPERLQHILQRSVAAGLIKKHQTPWDYSIGYPKQRRTWIYFKAQLDFLKDPEKILGYSWISDSILV